MLGRQRLGGGMRLARTVGRDVGLAALRTKMRSSQTIGVALPAPGIGAFQRMLVSASHVIGGSASGAMPLACGPRQWCQLWSRDASGSPAVGGVQPACRAQKKCHTATQVISHWTENGSI